MQLSALQSQILRYVATATASGRTVAQIDCHRAVARYPQSSPVATYNSIRRMEARNLVRTAKDIPDRPQATSVRLTPDGCKALEAEAREATDT